jgi:HlyD family secretion protein
MTFQPLQRAGQSLPLLLFLALLAGCESNSPAVALPDPETVTSLGRLEPAGGVIPLGVAGPDRLAMILVEEGDWVSQGQAVAYLESEADRQTEKDLAYSQLQEAKERLAAVTLAMNKQIAEAQLQLQQVQEVEPRDIQSQEAKVSVLTEQLTNATRNLKRLRSLQTSSVPQQELERHELLVAQAQGELNAARALLKKTTSGHDLHVLAAKAQLETLAAGLARAEKEVPLRSLEQSLRVAEERLKHTVIRAKEGGHVLKVVSHPGESVGAQPILLLGDTRDMVAIAEVDETNVGRLRLGQTATVTSRALGTSLTGKVTQIGRMVAKNNVFDIDPGAEADRRVVEVKIALNNSAPAASFVHHQVEVSINVEDRAGR